MLRGPPGPVNPMPVGPSAGQSDPSPGTSSASRPGLAAANRLAVERHLMRATNVPDTIIDILQAARRPSTTRIYNSTWRSFASWCARQSIDPATASTVQVLGFLRQGFEAGLAPNTLRRQVSAISTILCCGSKRSLSHRALIRLFLRGVSNLRPSPVHRFLSWDLPRVLEALTKGPFEPLREVGSVFYPTRCPSCWPSLWPDVFPN